MTEAHPQQQRYRVIERLASGGMAEVFLAESAGIEGFKKQVAIKRVLPHLSEKKRFIAMFLDEARLSAQLSHSNVAQVFDIGVGDNAYFIVMEYVDGSDLKGIIEQAKKAHRAISVEVAVFIASKICEGLSYAHELKGPDGTPLQIVHRDMSPPNVLLTKYGEVKIVDFGLAKATSQLEKSEAGIIKGKFSYLAPEAALGQDVDHRVDIFAVGIILWEMLTGKRLFLGESDFQTVKLVQQAAVPPPSSHNPAVPPELDAIVAKALARDQSVRYVTARDLGRDLVRFLYTFGRPVSAYDVAEYVRVAMGSRKKTTQPKGSIIDKLIEEALLEFTSLQDDKAPKSRAANEPIKLPGFEDIGRWADAINVQAGGGGHGDEVMRMSIPHAAMIEGNLAALEDEDVPAAPPSSHSYSPPAMPVMQSLEAPLAPAAAKLPSVPPGPAVKAFASVPPPGMDPAAAGKGGGALKTVLLVAALAIIAAGAWFSYLIPH